MDYPTHPVYAVRADRQTGEWIGEARPTGERYTLTDWAARETGDDTHRDTYEGAGKNTRLIVITWVDCADDDTADEDEPDEDTTRCRDCGQLDVSGQCDDCARAR